MSTQVRDIVTVTISRETAKVKQASFSVPLILYPSVGCTEATVNTYTDESDLLDDGFESTDSAYIAASKLMGQELAPKQFKVGIYPSTDSYATGLNAVIAADNDWFALIAPARVKADILALAAIIETEIKMYVVSTDDAGVPTSATDDIATALKNLDYDNTMYFYSTDTANYPEAAMVGGEIPKKPGSSNWKFKTLTGITPDTLTSTQITHLNNKNANYYETVGGINMVSSEGIVASGEYADIIFGTLWLQTLLASDVFSILANNDKVPFTDAGISMVTGAIDGRMRIAADAPYNLLIKDSIVVNAPLRSEIPSADLLARFLDNVTFSADYQGAINSVSIAGKLSV